jgi:phage-related protein
LYNSKAYRLFAFCDKSKKNNTVVISTHGILKKTQKTPTKEIEKAENIRIEYLKNKDDEKGK